MKAVNFLRKLLGNLLKRQKNKGFKPAPDITGWKTTFKNAETTSGSKRIPDPLKMARETSGRSLCLKLGEEKITSS